MKSYSIEEFIFRAPTDCVQYLTGPTGEFQSYNQQEGRQLRTQSYNICLRQEAGEALIYFQPALSLRILVVLPNNNLPERQNLLTLKKTMIFVYSVDCIS